MTHFQQKTVDSHWVVGNQAVLVDVLFRSANIELEWMWDSGAGADDVCIASCENRICTIILLTSPSH